MSSRAAGPSRLSFLVQFFAVCPVLDRFNTALCAFILLQAANSLDSMGWASKHKVLQDEASVRARKFGGRSSQQATYAMSMEYLQRLLSRCFSTYKTTFGGLSHPPRPSSLARVFAACLTQRWGLNFASCAKHTRQPCKTVLFALASGHEDDGTLDLAVHLFRAACTITDTDADQVLIGLLRTWPDALCALMAEKNANRPSLAQATDEDLHQCVQKSLPALSYRFIPACWYLLERVSGVWSAHMGS